MNDSQSSSDLAPIDLNLPSPKQVPPLSVTYNDGRNNITAIYPQALEGLVNQPKAQPPAMESLQRHPLIVAITLLIVGIALAVPLAALGTIFEALSPNEVHYYGK